MEVFRVYLNTEHGRKSVETMADTPANAATYARTLIGGIVVKTKRIADFTGHPVPSDIIQIRRMASSGPNLQQIPKHTPEGVAVREAAIRWLGVDYGGADYSVIENHIVEAMGVPRSDFPQDA